MSVQKNIESLSDHPLFRALVLMGGGLAVGCGGVAQGGAPVDTDTASAGSASGGAPNGGTASDIVLSNLAGSANVVGAAGASSQAAAGAGSNNPYDPSCPYAQWDCSSAATSEFCRLNLQSKGDPRASGCVCDTSRPTSAFACKSEEAFVCRQAYPPYVATQPWPTTWDRSLHVQCACVPAPQPKYECSATCASAFSGTGATQCSLPNDTACDERGVCTATSADVLRQDGIMCGCADIGLK